MYDIERKYGRLTPLREVERKNGYRRVLCVCDCGNERIVLLKNLKSGNSKSCGCLNKENLSKARLIDLTGKVFGKLTVIERVEDRTNSGFAQWLCKCACGNTSVVLSNALNSGATKSCGCEQGSLEHSKDWTAKDDAEIIRLEDNGFTHKEIAEHTNRTIGAVTKRLAKLKKETNE